MLQFYQIRPRRSAPFRVNFREKTITRRYVRRNSCGFSKSDVISARRSRQDDIRGCLRNASAGSCRQSSASENRRDV